MQEKKSKIRAVFLAREVPIQLFGTKHAARTKKLVFLTLASYANPDGTNAHPSNATLIRQCGLSDKGLRNTIIWLKEHSFLEVLYKRGPKGTNVHNLIFPDAVLLGTTSVSALEKAVPVVTAPDAAVKAAVPVVCSSPDRKRPYIDRERDREKSTRHQVVIKEIYRRDGTTTQKQLSAIEKLVRDNDWTDGEIKKAVGEVLDHLDDWEMKQAGDRVLTGLAAKIELNREDSRKAEETKRLIELRQQEARREAEDRLRELEAEEIEDHL